MRPTRQLESSDSQRWLPIKTAWSLNMFWWPDCTPDQINQTLFGAGCRHQNFTNFPRQFQLVAKFTTTALDWHLSQRNLLGFVKLQIPGFSPRGSDSAVLGWGPAFLTSSRRRWCSSLGSICLRPTSKMCSWTQNQWGGVVFCRGVVHAGNMTPKEFSRPK